MDVSILDILGMILGIFLLLLSTVLLIGYDRLKGIFLMSTPDLRVYDPVLNKIVNPSITTKIPPPPIPMPQPPPPPLRPPIPMPPPPTPMPPAIPSMLPPFSPSMSTTPTTPSPPQTLRVPPSTPWSQDYLLGPGTTTPPMLPTGYLQAPIIQK